MPPTKAILKEPTFIATTSVANSTIYCSSDRFVKLIKLKRIGYSLMLL